MLALTLAGTGETVIWIAAVGTSAGLIARSPPARWLWRRNVREPFTGWFRAEVAAVVDERLDARPLTNGKGWEAMQAIADQVGADVATPRPQTDDQGEP